MNALALVEPHLGGGRPVELLPGQRADVALHWQHGRLGARLLEALTTEVVAAARASLVATEPPVRAGRLPGRSSRRSSPPPCRGRCGADPAHPAAGQIDAAAFGRRRFGKRGRTGCALRRCSASDGAQAAWSDVTDTPADPPLARGAPAHIRSDQGPGFVPAAVTGWMDDVEAKTGCVGKASRWKNGHCAAERAAGGCVAGRSPAAPSARSRTGGWGGIRTHETLLTSTHFPGVRLRPLGHPSSAGAGF
jgi:hypothetical protein